MKRVLFVLLILLAGCGRAEPRMASTDEPVRDLAGYDARLQELWSELDQVAPERGMTQSLANDREGAPLELLSRAQPADNCRIAADLLDRICDLAQRICDIADREPSAADVALKCQRASDGCRSGRDRVNSACGGGR